MLDMGESLSGGLGSLPYDYAPAWWLTRIETDGQGHLVETPIRPLRPHEVSLLEAAIGERARPPRTMRDELDAAMQARRDRILDVLADGPLSTASVARATGLDRQAARYALRRMRDAGKVELVNHRWRLTRDGQHAE